MTINKAQENMRCYEVTYTRTYEGKAYLRHANVFAFNKEDAKKRVEKYVKKVYGATISDAMVSRLS